MPRQENFLPDGHRVQVQASQVADLWRRHTGRIPCSYALGTAKHESSFTINEVDTEESGYVSKGIFQLSDGEAQEVGCPHADLLDLEDATVVFVLLAERRLAALLQAIGADPAQPPRDIWAYLALAHNQGLHAALKTLRLYGLSWERYKARNPHLEGMARYGDDVLPPAPAASV